MAPGEMNCRFLQKKLGEPTFFPLSKFKEFFIIQFSDIPSNSLLQSDLTLHEITNIRWYNASVYITYTERDTEV